MQITAFDTVTGEVVAEFHISLWDYCTTAMWKYATSYAKYGGRLGPEELKLCLRRMKHSNISYEAERKFTHERKAITELTVKKLSGQGIAAGWPDEYVENPERLLKCYSELKKFFKTCIEQETIIEIHVT